MRELARDYNLMLRWEAARMLPILPIVFVLQTLIAGSSVLGLALLIPEIDSRSALFLATGGPTVALLSVGLNIVPQTLSDAKTRGALDFLNSLPLARMAYPAAMLTVMLFVSLPGMAIGLAIGAMRFDFTLHPSLLVVPAMLLVGLSPTVAGYALAVVSPNQTVTSVVTAFSLFGVLLFSPVNYPAERLPDWLASVHRVLPVEHMATLVRGTVTGEGAVALSFLVVGAWTVAALGLASMVSMYRD